MQKNWLVFNINKKFFLKAGNKVFRCQIGEAGLQTVTRKIEGDKTTPIGKWLLKTIYYRSDRVLKPKLRKKILKINRISKQCGWCDDFNSIFYNKYIKINYLRSLDISYENLWREDQAYDIIIVLSHNTKPTIKNKGSAIFIHCSFSDNRKTSGCIALKKKDMLYLIKNLQHITHLKIQI